MAKSDAVRKNVLGAGLMNMMKGNHSYSLNQQQNAQTLPPAASAGSFPGGLGALLAQAKQAKLQGGHQTPAKLDLLSQSLALPQTGPKPPQKSLAQGANTIGAPNLVKERPSEFIYEYDFDENGALYFLGSFGKKRLWQNPHQIGQVQAFASSIGAGTVDLFVGRIATNCRTQNEPFSYYGVDLGEGRQILPTCYTIRNRNSTTHVMMNWHLEGSNDKVNWIILDRRIYLTSPTGADHDMDEDQKHLRQKGVASTWGIDTDIYREIGFDGFRFFRVI